MRFYEGIRGKLIRFAQSLSRYVFGSFTLRASRTKSSYLKRGREWEHEVSFD